ncbi:hypothetical protein DRO60_05485 [Candidatus Bathyarchaeota archaeon]|nr:MAG: hypothetical protein DRO60_05485 [Candidatus Bathyarchaeota archaeon]
MDQLIEALRTIEFKLRRAVSNLKAKEHHYMQKCCYSLMQKDRQSAIFYAGAVSGVRVALMLTSRIEACVVELRVRLISYKELIVIWEQIGPSIPEVEKLAKRVKEAMPWVEKYIEELKSNVEALRSLDHELPDINVEIVARGIGNLPVVPEDILKEVEELLRKRAAKGLPVPPARAEVEEAQPEAVSLSSGPLSGSVGSANAVEKPLAGAAQENDGLPELPEDLEEMALMDKELYDAMRRLRNAERELRRW